MTVQILLLLILIIIGCLICKPIISIDNFEDEFVEDEYFQNEPDKLSNYEILVIYLYNSNPVSKNNMFNTTFWTRNEGILRTELNKTYNSPIKVFHYNLQSQLNFIVNREHPALWSLISPDCLPNNTDESKIVPTLQYDQNGLLIANNQYLNGEISSKLLLCMIPLNNKCTYTKLPVKWNIQLSSILTNKNKSITQTNIVPLVVDAVRKRLPITLPTQSLIQQQTTNPNKELVIYNNTSYFDRAINRGIDFWTKNYVECPPATVCPPPTVCPRVNDNIENYEIHLVYIYNANPSNSFNFYANIWIPKKQELINRLRILYPNIIVNDYRMIVDTKALASNEMLWTVTNMYARQGPASRVLRPNVTAGNGFEFDANGNFVQSSYTQTAMNPQIVLCLLPRNNNCVFTKVPIKWHIPDGVWVKGPTGTPVINSTNIVSELEKAVADRIPVSTLHRNQPIQSYQNIISDPNIWVFNPNSYTDPVVAKAVSRFNTFN